MDNKEKKAKKLGEVLAFARVGQDTFTNGKIGLVKVWDDSEVDDLIEVNKNHDESIESLISKLDESEVGLDKAKATGEKLMKMRDMYIGDDWDDPIEMFEWLGFFQGAAIVHWSLIKGFAEKEGDGEMEDLANKVISYHRDLFERVNESIRESVK